jgi:stage III sporulation protein AG
MSPGMFDANKFFGKFKGKKISLIIVIVGILGIVLIFLSDFIHFSSGSQQNSSNTQTASSSFEADTAKRLEDIIGQISGVGRVKVMVTVESGVENIYEKDNKETNEKTKDASDSDTQIQQSSETSHVIVDNDSGNQQALLTKQLQPEILGVVVVCDGGSNPDVQEAVTSTVSTALGIATNKISISKMQPNFR